MSLEASIFELLTFICCRIIRIQLFNGSLRQSCYLTPTLGKAELQLTKSCGGYIDPITLSIVPYIIQEGWNGTLKGYICPLGQVCKVHIASCPTREMLLRRCTMLGNQQSLEQPRAL